MGILTVDEIEKMQHDLADTRQKLQVSMSRVEELENTNKKKEKEIIRLKSTKATSKDNKRQRAGTRRNKRKP